MCAHSPRARYCWRASIVTSPGSPAKRIPDDCSTSQCVSGTVSKGIMERGWPQVINFTDTDNDVASDIDEDDDTREPRS
ncbi:hypothetical protein BKA82DRAFT_1001051 [Pisolithus tinctorius]|uniref:Uncharacterized protein n=1 Tax=Pisolithus tinctorius Marx 270 TaxID=870435 RepID=A0A0C3P887_PISTI|nr:hypothetical protein BKA82DRAFT_1001051 [Pisolithus tinctorius]KIO03886.1 hypothetical protein M404DRAFT_1001051 [Pisolithus tinctorius Marx 270]